MRTDVMYARRDTAMPSITKTIVRLLPLETSFLLEVSHCLPALILPVDEVLLPNDTESGVLAP